eukprot:TRINITY_DN3962_c0_g1_i1.p1 TRINITY_DN3962_c0_g1~~TRINITY_DN3962_c0_g1_i1.p1  ORF type:complete len:588 (+),score=138.92 TRINITY_DN3962_c0_g1_i1:51-1814(+)
MIGYLVVFILGVITVILVNKFVLNQSVSATNVAAAPGTQTASQQRKHEIELNALKGEVSELKRHLNISGGSPVMTAPVTTNTLQPAQRILNGSAGSSPMMRDSPPGSPVIISTSSGSPRVEVRKRTSTRSSSSLVPATAPMQHPSLANLLSSNPSHSNQVVKKSGWLEIRSFKKFSRRYFVLRGYFLSYYKNEMQRRQDCYGHIRIKDCHIEALPPSQGANLISIKGTGETIFFVQNPDTGHIAATTHRIFHSGSECILRCLDKASQEEWISKLNENAHSTITGAAGQSSAQLIPVEPVAGVQELSEEEYDEDSSLPVSLNNSGESTSGSITPAQQFPPLQLPEEQMIKISELKQEIGEQRMANEGFTEVDCKRFLTARQWRVEDAKLMVENYWQWKREFQPDTVTKDEVIEEVRKGKIHFYGLNKEGRPTVIIYAGKHQKGGDISLMVKFAIYVINSATAYMKYPIHTFDCVVDLKGTGVSSVDISFVKEAAAVFQNYFPERLNRVVCINSGFLIGSLWGMISPMLEERTRKKIGFTKNAKTLLAEHSDLFDAHHIPEDLGGSGTWTIAPDSIGVETFEQQIIEKQ